MGDCKLPGGWSFLDAAPAYSAFAGILGGFVFLGIVTLMTTRDPKEDDGDQGGPGHRLASRQNALMMFLPALLCLVISSFLFGEVSGEQVCARGYIEGTFAASLLGIGSIGVFGGIGLMLSVYAAGNRELSLTANVFTFISFFAVIAFLADSGVDVIENAFNNYAPFYAIGPIIAYGPTLLVLVSAVRLWLMPKDEHRGARARLRAVYSPASYVVVMVVTYSILTSYTPKSFPVTTLNDWRSFLAVGIALLLPGINLVVYARAIPGNNAWPSIERLLGGWTNRVYQIAGLKHGIIRRAVLGDTSNEASGGEIADES